MPDDATLAFYEKEAPLYTASGAQGQSRHLDAFLDRLNPGAHVLELGCGGGRDAGHMAKRGFLVDPTDGCAAMVRKARERTGLEARQMRFDELVAEVEYDAVWAHASLLHVPRNELPDALQRIVRALKPGGWHFANFKTGDGEGRDRFGRYYNYPDRAWLENAFRAAGGWELVDTVEYSGSGYEGGVSPWIALTLQKLG